jgi:hypothetical protein
MISEMLCVPLTAGGQTLVELHLNHRVLPSDGVPYTRKKRVKHVFIVRDQGQDIKFEVFARAIVLPNSRKISAGHTIGLRRSISGKVA